MSVNGFFVPDYLTRSDVCAMAEYVVAHAGKAGPAYQIKMECGWTRHLYQADNVWVGVSETGSGVVLVKQVVGQGRFRSVTAVCTSGWKESFDFLTGLIAECGESKAVRVYNMSGKGRVLICKEWEGADGKKHVRNYVGKDFPDVTSRGDYKGLIPGLNPFYTLYTTVRRERKE